MAEDGTVFKTSKEAYAHNCRAIKVDDAHSWVEKYLHTFDEEAQFQIAVSLKRRGRELMALLP